MQPRFREPMMIAAVDVQYACQMQIHAANADKKPKACRQMWLWGLDDPAERNSSTQ
jgi:hypothetical protein